MKKTVFCIASVLLLLISMLFSGCQNTDTNTFKTFTMNEGTVHFSFEYTSHYKVDSRHSGFVAFHDKLTMKEYIYGFIFVSLRDTSANCPNVKMAIEQIAANELNKNILERSSINMNGLSGELIVYSFKPGMIVEAPVEAWNIVRVNRTAYFDFGGLLLTIEIESDEDKADQAKIDFEHILQTFKILD